MIGFQESWPLRQVIRNLNAAFATDVRVYGAVGDGTTDDTNAIQTAINTVKDVYIPPGDFLISSALTLGNDSTLFGGGWDSVITTSTANHDLISCSSVDRVTIRDLKLDGVASTTNGNGILFTGCDDCLVYHCEIEGVSRDGVRATTVSRRITVEGCYFHDFTGSQQDSSDINFYSNCQYSTARGNFCYGGNWHGIKFQLTSYYNSAIGNIVGAHTAYGIVATYETTPAKTYNKVIGNTIFDITGAALISGQERAGNGIYGVAGGNVIISNNSVRNTNTSTDVEVLTPAGIGLSDMQGNCTISHNEVNSCDWYGIAVFSSDQAQVSIDGNIIEDCDRHHIYTKDSDHVSITNNTVWNTTNTQRGISVRHQTGTCTDIVVNNNNLYGDTTSGMGNGIYFQNVDDFTCVGNKIKETSGYSLVCETSEYGAISGNTIKDCGGTAAFRTVTAGNLQVTGNVFEGNSTYSVEVAGSSATNVYITDNLLSPLVVNNGQGAIIRAYGTAAPASGTWAQGDTIIDKTPSASGTKGWVCTTGGTQGTWKTYGSISA